MGVGDGVTSPVSFPACCLVQVMEEIRQNKIQVFIPEFDEDDSPGVREMRENIPFAVVGSERMLEVGGKKVRARQYPWGVVEGVWKGGGEGDDVHGCLGMHLVGLGRMMCVILEWTESLFSSCHHSVSCPSIYVSRVCVCVCSGEQGAQ